MSDPHEGKPFPRGVLYAAAALILFTMLMVFAAQRTELGTVRLPQVAAESQVEVRFEDLGADGLGVLDAATGTTLARVPQGQDGFIRGVIRGVNRTRKLDGLEPQMVFRLARWTDGRLSLIDPETEEVVDLRGFGATNLDAFARLVEAAEAEQ